MQWVISTSLTTTLIAAVLCLSATFLMPARHARAQDAEPDVAPPAQAPAPELLPLEVILAQLTGLQNAGDPEAPEETGMRVVWNFAAPANREVTGPFERFDAMVRAHPFAPLVGHHSHEVAHLTQDPELGVAQALIAVTHGPDRETAWFVWRLSRPVEGESANCWVTDAVYPVELDDEPSDPGQIA
ncbi:hypothetical protein [Algisphaera agarilytica]|uniref:DUF4864 domain-containing protein n=1 Tax=Algisphaera agarilytica TaxID=1385975 RepID=A0A7X0LL38_9BACT|nr:hypothetical protein [Algisphaera agarilytica]MBB6429588.1 hypothetical protein [Algisphaera agarilytica]